MPRVISFIDSTMMRVALGANVVFAAALVMFPIERAAGIGLAYVDADAGENGPANLEPLSNIAMADDPPETNDGLWSYRSDGGAAMPGNIFKSVFEASGGNNPEDAPIINQTVSGLAASTSYDVYVVYWQGAQAGHDWTIRAGFSSDNLTLFNAKGPSATFPTAVAGANALYHEWEPAAAPTNPGIDPKPLFVEAGRTLLLGNLGATTSSGAGQISVFIDDLPTTIGGPGIGPSGSRTWFDGLAYVPAGTNVFIAPGDFNDDNSIDPADAHIFLVNLHTDVSQFTALDTYRLGDLNADLLINHTDFVAFKDFYDAANGAGAFDALLATVPEPASFVMFAVSLAFLAAAATRQRRRQLQFAFRRAPHVGKVTRHLTGCVLFSFLVAAADAAPVTGWIAVNSQGGGATTKQLINANTNGPILGDGSDNGAGQVALFADINGTLDAAPDVVLGNGQKITLTGSVNLEGITNSMEQFRWGLFFEQNTLVDALGWLGYFATNSAGTGGGALRAKTSPPTTDLFAANGGSVNLRSVQDGDAFAPGSYDFSMSISRFDNDLTIDASLTNDTWSQVWSNVLPTDPNQATFNFNRVGFLSGNGMSPDRLTFSDIELVTSPVDALTLRVITTGPNAGAVQMRNNSGLTYEIDYYEITSVAGSLNSAGWTSIDDQEGGDPETIGWDEAPASDANLLSEINLQSTAIMAPAASFNLGQAFNAAGTQDLRFFYGLSDGTLARGIVQYVSGSLTGDYNGNNVVDAADYVVWRKTLNQNVPNGSGADGDGNGIVQQADYLLWRANFGKTGVAGAALAAGTAIPEPTSFALTALAVVAFAGSAKLRGRRTAAAK